MMYDGVDQRRKMSGKSTASALLGFTIGVGKDRGSRIHMHQDWRLICGSFPKEELTTAQRRLLFFIQDVNWPCS